MKLAVCFTMYFLAPAALAAEPPTSAIEGTALDSTGGPLYGAGVEVHGARGVLVASTTTTADGGFAVEAPSGTYTVTVWMPGFSVWRESVVAGETPRLRVVLEPAPFSEEISVTATRNEVPIDRAPQPVSVATRVDILLSTIRMYLQR